MGVCKERPPAAPGSASSGAHPSKRAVRIGTMTPEPTHAPQARPSRCRSSVQTAQAQTTTEEFVEVRAWPFAAPPHRRRLVERPVAWAAQHGRPLGCAERRVVHFAFAPASERSRASVRASMRCCAAALLRGQRAGKTLRSRAGVDRAPCVRRGGRRAGGEQDLGFARQARKQRTSHTRRLPPRPHTPRAARPAQAPGPALCAW